ncbi:hypothetical protein [Thermomonospora umbrina]|uniref:Uncharacterized protein n=1 Tax=Thermomonospora umbrina TaxID=111806 RepID=A0A3D9SVG9_9ACTN|nr:hypothetical protein [Thermomonospora umbrina]REE96574.1 hypothetical protein DFJ69_2012 [Thermomonospora umbrina]
MAVIAEPDHLWDDIQVIEGERGKSALDAPAVHDILGRRRPAAEEEAEVRERSRFLDREFRRAVATCRAAFGEGPERCWIVDGTGASTLGHLAAIPETDARERHASFRWESERE